MAKQHWVGSGEEVVAAVAGTCWHCCCGGGCCCYYWVYQTDPNDCCLALAGRNRDCRAFAGVVADV